MLTYSEYWITTEDEDYNKLMNDVSHFVKNPGKLDVPISEVFSDVCFANNLRIHLTKSN
jgi:hypothetical protein